MVKKLFFLEEHSLCPDSMNKDLLHIYSSKVLQMITSKEPGWEKMVPTAVAKEINKKGLFGHPCFISKEKP